MRKTQAIYAVCAVAVTMTVVGGCSSSAHSTFGPTATATTSATTAAAHATLRSCAQQTGYDYPTDAVQPPKAVTDFRAVQFDQSSMGFYGVSLSGAAQTVLGQNDANCSYVIGGNGSTHITITGSQATVYETYLPGGIEIIAEDLCDSFPEFSAPIAAQLGASDPSCTYKGSTGVHEISTGLPVQSLRVGIVKIPAGSAAYLSQQLPASKQYTTWLLNYGNTNVVMGSAGTDLDFKSIACAATSAEQKICIASLEYFISGLIRQAGYGKPDFSTLYSEVSGYVSRS